MVVCVKLPYDGECLCVGCQSPTHMQPTECGLPLIYACMSAMQLELQTSYDEVVQELRGLEVERETLWFQVDVLQDALEGAEEMLAEAQREASHASMVQPEIYLSTLKA